MNVAKLAKVAAAALLLTGFTGCSMLPSLPIPGLNNIPGVGGVSDNAGSFSVNGKAIGSKYSAVCSKLGGQPAMIMTGEADKEYTSILITIGLSADLNSVVALAANMTTETGMITVGYAPEGEGSEGTSAKLSKMGDTYTITGKGLYVEDMASTEMKTADFEIKATCRF